MFLVISVIELKLVEKPELERRLGASYKEYRQRVPMLIPVPAGRFAWGQSLLRPDLDCVRTLTEPFRFGTVQSRVFRVTVRGLELPAWTRVAAGALRRTAAPSIRAGPSRTGAQSCWGREAGDSPGIESRCPVSKRNCLRDAIFCLAEAPPSLYTAPLHSRAGTLLLADVPLHAGGALCYGVSHSSQYSHCS